MRKIHIAISVDDLDASIKDYTLRLKIAPEVIVPARYALFRTEILNVSLSQLPNTKGGALRHLGFEDETATEFTENQDVNGLTWEEFSASLQREEILQRWPNAIFKEKN